MLDVYQVLARKERDLERVRREVEALTRVIALLDERSPEPASSAERTEAPSPAPPRPVAGPMERGMAELELYYPFVSRRIERA